jgi:8-oxo-dGTP pyrophosphatase MutT (NUDIX family)
MKKIVASLIFNEHLQILLQLRDDKVNLRSAGMWSLPGGHIEDGESMTDAIEREVLEETNLRLEDPFFFLSLIDFFEPGPPIEVHLFLAKISPPYKIVKGEGQQLKFFNLNQIENLKTNLYLKFVIDYAVTLLRIKLDF